jgi:hypothetical protein
MAHRNRVDPTGAIIESSMRCGWLGNRGCLHVGREVVRPWRSRAWITCVLEFKGRHVQQWQPGRWTALFFDDEAVALAAGHRPCAECRRADYNRFLDAATDVLGARPRATELDVLLHADRREGSGQRTRQASWASLPDGTFVRSDGGPAVVVGDAVVPWADGYGAAQARPSSGDVVVLTPKLTVDVLRAGYVPQIGAVV